MTQSVLWTTVPLCKIPYRTHYLPYTPDTGRYLPLCNKLDSWKWSFRLRACYMKSFLIVCPTNCCNGFPSTPEVLAWPTNNFQERYGRYSTVRTVLFSPVLWIRYLRGGWSGPASFLYSDPAFQFLNEEIENVWERDFLSIFIAFPVLLNFCNYQMRFWMVGTVSR